PGRRGPRRAGRPGSRPAVQPGGPGPVLAHPRHPPAGAVPLAHPGHAGAAGAGRGLVPLAVPRAVARAGLVRPPLAAAPPGLGLAYRLFRSEPGPALAPAEA